MSSTHYPNAPVVESVIGLQFAPIPKLGKVHFGQYANTCLSEDWSKTVDAPALPTLMERFEDEAFISQVEFQISPQKDPERVLFYSKDDRKIIQLQNNRFLCNWRKSDPDEYVCFEERVREFKEEFEKFKSFLVKMDLGEISLNQWEVTYFNQIPQGELWTSPRDWRKIFPSLMPEILEIDGAYPLEKIESQIHFEIPPKRGRLHLKFQNQTLPDAKSVLLWTQITRGSVDNSSSWEEAISLGHDAIIDSFEKHSSSFAKKYWKQTQ